MRRTPAWVTLAGIAGLLLVAPLGDSLRLESLAERTFTAEPPSARGTDSQRAGLNIEAAPPHRLAARPRNPHQASRPTDRAVTEEIKTPATHAPANDESLASAADLWRHWQRLLEHGAFQQIPIVNAKLADRLHQDADGRVYQEIADMLGDDKVSMTAKSLLLDLLGEIATPEAVNILLSAAREGGRSALYAPLLITLSQLGDNRWDGRYHEELSPLLERLWSESDTTDLPLLRAVGRAIVGIGAPSGVERLLQTLKGRNDSGESLDRIRERQIIVFTDLPKITNPAAIPVLEAGLTGSGQSDGTDPPGTSPASTSLTPNQPAPPIPDPVTTPTLGTTGDSEPDSISTLAPPILKGLENIGTDDALRAVSVYAGETASSTTSAESGQTAPAGTNDALQVMPDGAARLIP